MMITKKLLDVCDFQGGTQPPKDEWVNDPREGYVRMLQIRDYSQGDAKFIQYVKDTKKLHKCKKDDIMLSRYGYIGQAFMGLEGAYNVALVKVIKKEEIYTPYLLYYFQSYYFQHFLLSNVGARATIPGFNKEELENALIKIPEMSEQLEIASKIAKVDELIGFHKQQLDVLDTLIKSRFIEMFGTLSSNEHHYPMSALKDVCRKITDGKHGGCEQEAESGYYYVGAREIYDGGIHYDTAPQITKADFEKDYRRCNLEQGDFVLVNTGATIGKSAIAKHPLTECTLLQKSVAMFKVKPEIISTVFLKYCYEANPEMYTVESASAQPNLLLSRINSTQIYLPPIECQRQFASFVEQVDKSKFYIVQTKILLELLTRAIQHETNEVPL